MRELEARVPGGMTGTMRQFSLDRRGPGFRCEKGIPQLDFGPFLSIITVEDGHTNWHLSRPGGKSPSCEIIPRVIAGFGVERSKAVTPDQMEVLEILGKRNQSGHRTPIRMSKTTGFPGRNVLMRKGGVAGGVKNAKFQEIRGSKWSNAVISSAFWSKSREFGRI